MYIPHRIALMMIYCGKILQFPFEYLFSSKFYWNGKLIVPEWTIKMIEWLTFLYYRTFSCSEWNYNISWNALENIEIECGTFYFLGSSVGANVILVSFIMCFLHLFREIWENSVQNNCYCFIMLGRCIMHFLEIFQNIQNSWRKCWQKTYKTDEKKFNRFIHALLAFAPPVVTSNKHNVDTFNELNQHESVYSSSESAYFKLSTVEMLLSSFKLNYVCWLQQ